AIAQSGNYYFNQHDEPFSASPRYRLQPDDDADSWFYATIADKAPYNINVNPDAKLGITRVWMNIQIRDGERVLGIAGASVDLTEFLGTLSGSARAGVVPMIIDRDGAIQAHIDPAHIAFNSGAAPAAGDSSIFSSLSPADGSLLRQAMADTRKQP